MPPSVIDASLCLIRPSCFDYLNILLYSGRVTGGRLGDASSALGTSGEGLWRRLQAPHVPALSTITLSEPTHGSTLFMFLFFGSCLHSVPGSACKPAGACKQTCRDIFPLDGFPSFPLFGVCQSLSLFVGK